MICIHSSGRLMLSDPLVQWSLIFLAHDLLVSTCDLYSLVAQYAANPDLKRLNYPETHKKNTKI